MVRRLFAAMFALLVLFSATGCEEDSVESAVVYYNGYLGLAVSPPEGWQISERDESNMTRLPENSVELLDLSAVPYGDGGKYYDLLTMHNGYAYDDDNYLEIHLFAEDYRAKFMNADAYLSACKTAYTGRQPGGYYSEYIKMNERKLEGLPYSRLLFYASPSSEGKGYYEEYYIRKIGNLYFTACVKYGEGYPSYSSTNGIYLRSLAGCFSLEADDDFPAAPTGSFPEQRTYVNTYLGLEVSAPEELYLWTIHDDNLSGDPAATLDLAQMQREAYNDGGFYYDLIRLQNTNYSSETDFAQLDLFVEDYPAFTSFSDYLDAAEIAYAGAVVDGFASRLQERGAYTLGGVRYERIVTRSDGRSYAYAPYIEEYYITEVKGLYFVACLRYWQDSDKSRDDAKEMLQAFTLDLQPVSQ